MSIVDDQVQQFDTLLDRYQVANVSSRKSSIVESESLVATSSADDTHTTKLKSIIRSLSATASSRPIINRSRLRGLIKELNSIHGNVHATSLTDVACTFPCMEFNSLISPRNRSRLRGLIKELNSIHGNVHATSVNDEDDLVWLATGKATVQLYGLVLNSLLEQTIPLSESMWYWDDVLGSYIKTSLYMLQTSPIRFFNASQEIYREAKSRYTSKYSVRDAAEESKQTLAEGWKQFYRLVQDSIKDRSLVQARTRILTPFALSRTEARQKQERLKKLREQSATAIGLLVDEGMTFPTVHEVQIERVDWRSTVAKSVTILESILHHSRSIENNVSDYEYNVIETIDNTENSDQPSQLTARMLHILNEHLPQEERSAQVMALDCGMPSRWVRYWIPGVILLLSGSTLLRIFANRRAEITTWIREAGQTTVDFWQNWVIEPTRRLIGTIRHDENTELALMSKDSLKSDRESLERMVVDFAVENPENGRAYNETEIAAIRAKVKEGDLTPVLRAYEQEMKSPVVRAVTGNLIRALLIQIQKTKVDVEVAIGGIDSLLKSQELLFGFVGVAPGILLSYFVAQWLRGVLGGRRGIRQSQQKGETIRLLRNIDRTLTNCTPTENGIITYKDHGLLICEVHVLRQRAVSILPGRVQREFLEDVGDLLDIRQGIAKQMKVVERIHWAYSKWLK